LKHILSSLLRPKSIVVIGASKRPDSVGDWALRNLVKGGYKGTIYPVNPSYEAIEDIPCYEDLSSLPEIPELAIFAIGDHRIEEVLDEVIKLQIPAAVIFSSLNLDDDKKPFLKERLQKKIQNSGLLVCGANGMGFYNIRDNVWACGFDSSFHHSPGNVSLISHSGSGMSGILDCEARLRFNFAVSTGNELSVTMDQYLDFVLDLPETKVVGLFIETARNPQGFLAALKKAKLKKIPIVALKVGRTDVSAKLTLSHSGAMAGDDDTYDAIFDKYCVQRVRDMDELATALILFAEFGVVGDGGLVTLHDSGGERQLLVDLADEVGVPLANLDKKTVLGLEKIIDPELPAINPLDVWSRGGPGAVDQYSKSATLMLGDPNASIAALVLDRAPQGRIYPSYIDYLKVAKAESNKPIILVSSRQGSGADESAITATHQGYPILDGVTSTLTGIKKLFSFRDSLKRNALKYENRDSKIIDKWSLILSNSGVMTENDSLSLIRDFGIPVVSHQVASSKNRALKAAKEIGFPVALKTAMPNIHHKSECGGVMLDIQCEEELITSYNKMNDHLGKNVIVTKMQLQGQEMILGVKNDPQFGPIIILGLGGFFTELMKDIVFAVPPFNEEFALELLGKLKFHEALMGYRESKLLNITSFCKYASRFSFMVHELREVISEIDINPLIINQADCVAVDALIVGKRNISP
jgi:acetate---CoA ligase (ADP-forming)